MNATQREALRYALKLGLPAFPCHPNKRPATPHGYKDAALPEAGLATLWARYPGELIGVPTGAFSGIDVLDVDRGKGGDEWYAANKAALPPTRIHRTRSGGLHLLFKHHPGLRLNVGKIARGIDVRADGGSAIWWPQQGLEVREHPIDKLPPWPEFILAILKKEKIITECSNEAKYRSEGASLDAKLLGIAKRVERAQEGERNPSHSGPPVVSPTSPSRARCRATGALSSSRLPRSAPAFRVMRQGARLTVAWRGLRDGRPDPRRVSRRTEGASRCNGGLPGGIVSAAAAMDRSRDNP
jgi:hypothetical protein